MRAEDEQAYTDYLRVRLPRLYRTAYLLCGDRHLAEDVAQGTALTLYRKWKRVRRADNLDAYVYRMLVNQLRGELRRPWSRVVVTDQPPEPPAPPGPGPEDGEAVRAALAELGHRQRAVLVLRYYCDLTVEQTADVLECSAGTVKSQSARALARMRTRLAAAGPEYARLARREGDSA